MLATQARQPVTHFELALAGAAVGAKSVSTAFPLEYHDAPRPTGLKAVTALQTRTSLSERFILSSSVNNVLPRCL